MKDTFLSFILKGTALALCGTIIAFFPNNIAMIFYILGGIIIIGCIGKFFSTLSKKSGGPVLTVSFIGALVGAFVICLPHIFSIQALVIAGLMFGYLGFTRIIKGISTEVKNIPFIIIGTVLIAVAIFFIFNPFKASAVFRIGTGVFMLLMALGYYITIIFSAYF